MSRERKEVGRWGEELAAKYYRERGYMVVDRNWRCRYGEIDLVCARLGALYFVEVKTRRGLMFGYPEEAITPQKWQRMLACGQAYLAQHRTYKRAQCVFHVCAIYTRYHRIFIRIYTNY